MLGSSHPALDRIAGYYFAAEGKHVRPLIVLLMAQAANGVAPGYERLREEDRKTQGAELDAEISPTGILNDVNPRRTVFAAPESENILCTQRRLADISEMIHVASLLHDDVLDEAALRRGAPSAPAAFGNKLAVLAGDFLLGRASVALARLGNLEVVELLATVLANLVEGEVLQLQAQQASEDALAAAPSPSVSLDTSAFWRVTPACPEDAPSEQLFESYLHKTYLKTAALMAKSARAAVILGGCGKADEGEVVERRKEQTRDAAYAFGRNLGIAFQVSSAPTRGIRGGLPERMQLSRAALLPSFALIRPLPWLTRPDRSWWTTCWTSAPPLPRSASPPAAPICAWASPLRPCSLHGKRRPPRRAWARWCGASLAAKGMCPRCVLSRSSHTCSTS
jgi:hexaprenyl-diphosphate synthase